MRTLYAALKSGFLKIDPAQATAVRSEALDGHSLECVAVPPTRPDRIFVGTFESGIQRSDDGGGTFTRVDEFDQDAVMSVAIQPDEPDEVWAGTEPSRVYRSVDGGESWSRLDGLTRLESSDEWSFPPRPHTHHVRWLQPDPEDADHWYVAIEAGALVQTHNCGTTWEDRVPTARLDTHEVTTHPDAPRRAWVAAGDGYAETHDGGETWDHPQDGLDHRYVWSVAVDPGQPDTVLISAAQSARRAHTAERAESYIYRRRGNGRWDRLDHPELATGDGVTRAVLERGNTDGEIYALNNRGLFVTTDAGDTWERIGIDWPSEFQSTTARGLEVV